MPRKKKSANKAGPTSKPGPQTSEAQPPVARGTKLLGQSKPSESKASTDVPTSRQPGDEGAELPEVPVDPLERRNWMIWCTEMLVSRLTPLCEAADKAWELGRRARQLSKEAETTYSVTEVRRLEANAEQLHDLADSTFQHLLKATAPFRPYWLRVCAFVAEEYVEVDPGLGLMHHGLWHKLPTPEVVDWLQAVHHSLVRHRNSGWGDFALPSLTQTRTDASSAKNEPALAKSTSALRDGQITLLMELSRKSHLVLASDLSGQSGMPCYDSIRRQLNELESMKPPLVERPKGERSGYCITSAGIQLLRKRELLPGSD